MTLPGRGARREDRRVVLRDELLVLYARTSDDADGMAGVHAHVNAAARAAGAVGRGSPRRRVRRTWPAGSASA